MSLQDDYKDAIANGDADTAEAILGQLESQAQHAQMEHTSPAVSHGDVLTGTDYDVYHAMSKEVADDPAMFSPIVPTSTFKKDDKGRVEQSTTWGLNPNVNQDKFTLGAGHAASMLLHGVANLADRAMPYDFGAKTFDDFEKGGEKRIANREADYQGNKIANKALTDNYGIPGIVGGMAPYVATTPFQAGAATKVGTAVTDALENALQFAAVQPKNLIGRLAQKFMPDVAKKEFMLPKLYEARKAANAVSDFKYDPRAGMIGQGAGNILSGVIDGYLRPDMTVGTGALGGLLGGLTNAAIGPSLSRANNPAIKGLNDVDFDTLNVAERNGWQPDTGMRYAKPKLQADLAKLRSQSDTLDQVGAFDSNRQLALNRWALRDIFGVKPEVANKMDSIEPDFINEHMKGLGKQLDDIDANSIGRFDKDAIDRINQHTKDVYSDATFVKDGTANLVKNYNDAIHGYRETATRLTPQTLTPADYSAITKSLNDIAATPEYGKFKAGDVLQKLIGFTKNMQGSKFMTPEHLALLDAHLSKVKSKAEGSMRPEAMQYYNDLTKAFSPLKEHLVNIRNPRGQFVANVDGKRLMNLRGDIADEIRGAEIKGDSRKANALRPILKEINTAQDAGIAHGGTVDSATSSKVRANYAMSKEMLNGGIHPNGNVDLSGVHNLVTSNPRMMEDALRGVGLQGHSIVDEFGSSIDPKSTMQHMARLHEIVKSQKNADLSMSGKASNDSLLHKVTRTPGSFIPNPVDQFVTTKLLHGGWPLETGALNLPYRGTESKYLRPHLSNSTNKLLDHRSGGVMSSNNLLFAGEQQKESSDRYGTGNQIKSLIELISDK
jgi:hypothetical protein